jgi:wobble nucleotide-excising tRNase
MYLKKIIGIKNLGKFRDAGISGGQYNKFTLFYAGNGGGKTTLCAAMRSYHANDPGIILERKTFDSVGSPEINLLLDGGPATFSNGKWKSTAPQIHIFDGRFVEENVHTGYEVNTDNRRNFYRTVVGPKGVELANKIDELDSQIVANQTKLTLEEKVLQQHVPKGTTLETFLALSADPNIEKKIVAARIGLKAAENGAEIEKRPQLVPANLPRLPEGFKATLAKTLEDVSAEAGAAIRAQIGKHKFHYDGEQWLATGLTHIAENSCPFCGNDLGNNELIRAYQGYFSAAYAAFKSELVELRSETVAALSEVSGIKAVQAFKTAEREATFWRQYVDIVVTFPDIVEKIGETLRTFYKAAIELIEKKIAAPFDKAPLTSEFGKAEADWANGIETLAACNDAMAPANALVQNFKDATAKRDKAAFQADLDGFAAINERHAEPVNSLANAYYKMLEEKSALVLQKNEKKEELDNYDAAIFGEYQDAINKYLKLCGASFTIVNCKKNYVGKMPQSTFCLQFDKSIVKVTAAGEDGNPSFGTTMSAGDKNTFALAFFLVLVDRDTSIAEKIVLFDDPFTSLAARGASSDS